VIDCPQRGVGATILVVDDDALITLNTVDVLTEMGHTALEAFSARQALSLLQTNPQIGALITDYAMPGMNGIELAGAARKLRPELPILLTSGYDEVPDAAGLAYAQLRKPFREAELSVRIAELLAPRAE